MLLRFPKLFQPLLILFFTSSMMLLLVLIIWPKYMYYSTFSSSLSSIYIDSGYICLLNITFVVSRFIFMPGILLLFFSSCNLVCRSFVLLDIITMLSTNLRWLSFLPLRYTPSSDHSTLLKISCSPAVNIFGDIVSPCPTPLRMLISAVSLSLWIVVEAFA